MNKRIFYLFLPLFFSCTPQIKEGDKIPPLNRTWSVHEYEYKGHLYIVVDRGIAHAGHCEGYHWNTEVPPPPPPPLIEE